MTPFDTELVVVVEGHPVSVNHMYTRTRRGAFKTAEASRWEMAATLAVKVAANRLWGSCDLRDFKGYPLEFELILMRDTWKGKTKAKRDLYVRPDLTNFIKSAEDSMCRALGLDDSAVVHFKASKAIYKNDCTWMKLKVLRKE